MPKALSWLAILSLTASAAVFLPQTATASDTASVATLFSSLTVTQETNTGYNRDLFQHWVDADNDGCDTRSEVLQQESLTPVTFNPGNCTVATGQWNSWYDGATWTNASDVDIDHLVPLAEAWGSGASAWTAEQRRDYANDLTLDVGLEAVTDNVNQSKSDRDPAEWMPPLAGTACRYATDWVLVKYRWQLTMDAAESAAVSNTLQGSCGTTQVTVPAIAIDTAPTQPITFSDVNSSTQFNVEISWLATQGISTGWVEANGTRTYRPLNAVNRDAMAAFLYRLAKKPAFTPPATSPFSDITPSSQFYKEITWLAASGISTGWTEANGTKTFRPLSPINRDAMAAFLYRYGGNPAFTAPGTSPFQDVPVSSQFYKQITWLAAQGISTGWDIGYGCRAFNPVQPVARDAMAAFMYRFVNGGNGGITGSNCSPPPPPVVTPPPAPKPPVTPPPPVVTPPKPANPGDTKNCKDFSTWRQAQDWFNYYYPHYGDIARLDGDGDGIACQSLPGHP
ncbi:S-layer homology domain-containing protein [Paenarthrobacter sp. UW852]|uniref:S-layer homology domain-containing protein n=1 Tax=Paenarthrobacter sp. UW852 TaxID=2951989 RepID=UPI002148CC94|nr:S-layer homology domain-containing protein [Paenarthrobacter sp. UW852]MCR1163654.1 S-layer homology domain-containing protein [Paenarthrobacter sp. UW852]